MYIQKAEEILQPRRHIQQVALTNRDELDMAYESNSDIASIGNALYRSRTKQNRLSDWYDNVTKNPTIWNAVPIINQYNSFMLGMQALPYLGNLAGKADAAVLYISLS